MEEGPQIAGLWPQFLVNAENRAWRIQRSLELPGKEVYRMTRDNLRAISDHFAKNLSEMLCGLLEHQFILVNVAKANRGVCVLRPPSPDSQAVHSNDKEKVPSRLVRHFSSSSIAQATGQLAEALTIVRQRRSAPGYRRCERLCMRRRKNSSNSSRCARQRMNVANKWRTALMLGPQLLKKEMLCLQDWNKLVSLSWS